MDMPISIRENWRDSFIHSGRSQTSQQGLLMLISITIRGGRILCPKITEQGKQISKVSWEAPIQVNQDKAEYHHHHSHRQNNHCNHGNHQGHQ